ncbi:MULTISPECIES: gamma-type small acid-soluble spore protein [Lysinibacillus]|uniref:Small, acid-soluble spore protein gamma-type n=1 Tax=Lysinibacillus xylanilyticus TaxID=582475 RepID=A0ABT4EN50_9BACI|nr:gamma-type small acid-soluble spore protein [Lysinibacillus xylanilyticus]MCY9547046.1 gamma-type small acid-soluble spore protein [Lysinibacillus xylanilyticus]MED3801165.1 gamma-type small acid-soluble spore protein [Lysinibacillus xylanilyticus]QPQ29230.1 gamma-type small acid-soluble spore protein [Lysinibacillus sp. JNUCC-51]
MKKQNNQNLQPNKNMQRQSQEFGYETDVNEVQKQNAKAEQNKAQASGNFNKTNQDLGE